VLKRATPIREMLRTGIPVGAGTDAARVASYNPFVSLYWLVTGRTVGGLEMYDAINRLDRMRALRLWTVGSSSWFTTEHEQKGAIVPGQFADLAILSADYLSVPDDEIKRLEHGAEEFSELTPAPPAGVRVTAYSPVANARSHRHGWTDHVFSGGVLVLGVLERRYGSANT
jgi:hypothetical protein